MTPVVPGLSCKELVELVTDYLEERMSAEDRTRFELHLSECEGCRTYLNQMRQILASTGKLREESISPEAERVLLAAFRGWKKGPADGRS